MKLVSCSEMQDLDKKTISEFGIAGKVLMERAGCGIAKTVLRVAGLSGRNKASIHLIAGKGNNGGDVFVAARHLKENGFFVQVWLAGKKSMIGGDSLEHLNTMKSMNIKLREMSKEQDWEDVLISREKGGEIIVDGILGTGIKGPSRGVAAGAIRYINSFSEKSPVIAVDVPSGLNADTGEAEGNTVIADITTTMGLPKKGFINQVVMDFTGTIEIIDIGIPEKLIKYIDSDKEMITAMDLQGLIKRRARDSHKGTFGHVLIVGGASGYAGSVAMAAKAAMRSGAGLVTALVPKSIVGIVSTIVPEAMVHPAPETDSGSLSSDCLKKWDRNIADFDSILTGPGMTTNPDTLCIVKQIIKNSSAPVILDADAINVCSNNINIIEKASCPIIITPHPGEMARLINSSVATIQKNRFKIALQVSESLNVVVVLKGAGTVVAKKGFPLNINMTGNPGMATGGTGDILAGMIAGFVAQGITPFDSARAGVYIHGKSGDNAAWRKTQASMTAWDIINEIPEVMKEISAR